MTERTFESRYLDAIEFEKLASGHDARAALNESQSKHAALSEVERALHSDLATLHGQMAAKYRALARAQHSPNQATSQERSDG